MSDNPTPGRFRNPTPATPFASDGDTSWQGELSWQFGPTGWRENHNLGSILSPWTGTSAASPLSDRSRSNILGRSANEYYLSRTTGGFRSHTNPYYYEHSGYDALPGGRIELQSFVGRERQNMNDHRKSPGFSKMGVIKERISTSTGPLADKDELTSKIDSYKPEDDDHLIGLSSHSTTGYHHHGHGDNNHHAFPSISQHSGHEYDGMDQVSYYDEEDEDEDEYDEGPAVKSIGLLSLFRYSTKLDMVLVILGCLGSLINGGALPWYSYFFGKFVNKIADGSSIDKTKMMKEVDRVWFLFCLMRFYLLIMLYYKHLPYYLNLIIETCLLI